ncbi:hypothetical protein VNO77_02390 [Canavalia gladiata]|uniref:Prolamin-like domain-containing protein n=1 Tax=Canavalia gladiata TaxID=3824 RepID=A0AAN9MZE7_CANGL
MISSTCAVESKSLYNPPSASLASRLKVEGESSNCWDSLWELQACTGEIITFFLNGETYLSHGCCRALRLIGHDCWPNIVDSLGFTNEETDILEGYCNQAFHSSPPPSLVHPKEMVP